jgi:hypothetical protein
MTLEEAMKEIFYHAFVFTLRPKKALEALKVIRKTLLDYKQLKADYIELDKRVRELKGRIDLFADNWLDEDERKDMEYYQTHFIADPIDLRYYETVAKIVEEKFYNRFYDFFAERMIKNKQQPQRKDDTR